MAPFAGFPPRRAATPGDPSARGKQDTEDYTMNNSPPKHTFKPLYSPWRHGGWYVHNIRYPSGACGCVSRNYPDGKWRIVCDERDPQPTYPSRDAAALAELELIKTMK